jgi:hypothetical protein
MPEHSNFTLHLCASPHCAHIAVWWLDVNACAVSIYAVQVARLYDAWVSTMPRVMPFYAVKCNPEPSMVAMLAALGAGFDCASIQELQLAAAHGVSQDRVIFANPCKRPADFRCADACRCAEPVVSCLQVSNSCTRSCLAVAGSCAPSPACATTGLDKDQRHHPLCLFMSLLAQVRC